MPINYKDYPDNWKTEIRPSILKRADDCCELCFVPNNQIVYRDKTTGKYWFSYFPKSKEVKIILTIHHIDFDRTNNKDYNLIALCQRCHLKLDLPNKIKKRSSNVKNIRN